MSKQEAMSKQEEEEDKPLEFTEEELCSLFGLDPAEDSTDLKVLDLEATVFNCCDADWNPHSLVPWNLTFDIVRQLRKCPLVPRDSIQSLEEAMLKPRDSCHQVVIIGRSTVLNEIGGSFSGPVADRVGRFLLNDNFLQVEANNNLSHRDTLNALRSVMASAPQSSLPFDSKGRPIFIVQKDEEESCSTYGDVAYSWPAKLPSKRRKQNADTFNRQLAINEQILPGGFSGLAQAIVQGGGSITVYK